MSFLAGSIPFGWVVARARGVDLQTEGSGNIGAANVARTVGPRLGALVLVLDALKGALPLVVALERGVAASGAVGPLHAAGAAAIVGHCFTPWLRFRGGKGVATSLGVCLVLVPDALAFAVLAFGLVFAARRVVSLAALVAAATLPVAGWLVGRTRGEVAFLGVLALVVGALHHENLARLRAGRERPIA
jgi:glycerol-3-phosphate acyltransferase PlsY